MKTEQPRQIERYSQQTALELKLSKRLLAINPGLGKKANEIANTLADSGFNAAMASMLMLSVYAPTDALGRGQSNRAQWFVAAIENRYSHKLDKIRNDPAAFRTFIADMEEVNEMRDTLKGEGVSLTFLDAFSLWEQGENETTILGLLEQTLSELPRGLAARYIVKASRVVRAGHCINLESAIREMRHGYQYEYRN